MKFILNQASYGNAILKLLKKKIFILLLFMVGISSLYGVDIYMRNLAINEIEKSNFYFTERLNEAQTYLNGQNSKKRCQLQNIFYIYTFQTCFWPAPTGQNGKFAGYYYVYQEPASKFTLFSANSQDDYYFSEVQLGDLKYHIKPDGIIQKL